MKIKNWIKPAVNEMLPWAAVFVLGYGCEKMLSGPKPTEYVDSSPAIGEIYALRHSTVEGLYLTVEEKSGRQINFYDYGFDGKLDRVLIKERRKFDAKVTNTLEVAKWQQIFEEMRHRRFGEYNLKEDLGLK